MNWQSINVWTVLLITFCNVNTMTCFDVNLDELASANNRSLIRHKTKNKPKDFLIVDRLSDNEQETRILWNDLAGKETLMLGKQILANETDR